ncbi:MAG: hypothetical protein Tsb002_32410 [Wenzhouxiangellaceae bacterium]
MVTTTLSAQSTPVEAVDDEPRLVISALEEGGFQVRATLRVAAPPRVVWSVLTDCGQAMNYVPGMRRCEVLESGPGYEVVVHKIRRHALLPALDYVFRSDYQPWSRISTQLLKGDLRQLHGEWRFEPCAADCTLLSYDFVAEARWYVSRRRERKALQSDVPEMLRRLREQSLAQWRMEQEARSAEESRQANSEDGESSSANDTASN